MQFEVNSFYQTSLNILNDHKLHIVNVHNLNCVGIYIRTYVHFTSQTGDSGSRFYAFIKQILIKFKFQVLN